MRPINCGFRCLKGSLFFLEVVPSIVNLVNNVYFLAYKVQQTFFVAVIKVTRPSYFVRVPSYFETLWYAHLYFDRKSNI